MEPLHEDKFYELVNRLSDYVHIHLEEYSKMPVDADRVWDKVCDLVEQFFDREITNYN